MSNKTKMILEATPMLFLMGFATTQSNPCWFLALLVYSLFFGYRWSED